MAADHLEIDSIALEVMSNRLDVIAEEMQLVLLKSAHSIIVKEGADASSAVFTPTGEVASQSTSQPLHLGALVPAVGRILSEFPIDEMHEGDVFCLNDPYDGGTHVPDLIVAVPTFFEGRVIAIGASLSHQMDFGGMVPGSMTIDATDHFQEGLILGPTRLYEKGKRNPTLFKIIERNIRIPQQVIGDIEAQVASGRTVARRINEVVADVGIEAFESSVQQLLDRAEVLTRREIAKLPNGSYTFEDYIDSDGITLDQRLPIRATINIEDESMAIDFEGTAPQAKGPVNTSPTGAFGPASYVMRAVTDATIPNNSGCYRPLSISVPPANLLNPVRPAPVAIRAQTLKRVADVLLGALAQAVPDRMPAASCGTLLAISWGGIDERTGKPWVYMEGNVGGTGAGLGADGVDDLDSDIMNASNVPAEALELEHCFRLWKNALRTDSGGPGRWRGGLGIERVLELREGEAVLSHRSDRHETAPWGLAGGKPAAKGKSIIVRANGEREEIPSRKTAVLRAGDRLHMFLPGGGGYGNPLERPAEVVLLDVQNRKVSQESAWRDYGVRIAEGRIDLAATEAERARRQSGENDGNVDA